MTDSTHPLVAAHPLVDAARTLASSLDLDAILREAMRMAVPEFGDYAQLFLRDASDAFVQIACTHADDTKRPLVEVLGKGDAEPGSQTGVCARVLGSGEPVHLRADELASAADPATRRVLAQLAPVSTIAVPLAAHGELLGILAVSSTNPARMHDARDVAGVELLGARIALAIDNARLYSMAEDARERAVRAAQLETQLAQARLEALQAQLNPHFLFNALNTIAMLVRRRANEEALRGVVSLSELLRKILMGNRALVVPLQEELAIVEHYLSIERLRYRDRLTATVTASAEAREAMVPSLVVQPLVENAVRHGIAPRREGGSVRVSCERTTDALAIEVRDDGVGLPDGWELANAGGIGLANTRERLERLYPGAHTFEIARSVPHGTVVRVIVPYRTTLPDENE